MSHNTDNSIPLPTGNTDSLPTGDAPGATISGPSPSSNPLPSGDERGPQPPAPSPSNNNQALIDQLRAAANFLELRENFPAFEGIVPLSFHVSTYSNAQPFIDAARQIGREGTLRMPKSCDEWSPLVHCELAFGSIVKLSIFSGASKVCKKVEREETVTVAEWKLVEPIFPDDCPF